MTVQPGWEIPMNRQYLEYIPEIGTPAANSHHGQQHRCTNSPNVRQQTLQTIMMQKLDLLGRTM
ncbi:hypothetical protein B2J88_22440 [Rhodococcus sp. SRB_17]|nr:hypothetical protein [Acidovorax sp. SRB_24]NMM87089.1 hypothetical protein [Rhodococcus sp. SRB_17]